MTQFSYMFVSVEASVWNSLRVGLAANLFQGHFHSHFSSYFITRLGSGSTDFRFQNIEVPGGLAWGVREHWVN